MRKITLTSILALSIACPAFADIATNNNNPKCDNTTIGAYSGSTELEAQWTANTIKLNWYDATGKMNISDEAPAASCTYAGNITLPTTPSRPGYTFNQWVVRAAAAPTPTTFDLSTWTYGTVPDWDEQYIQYRSLIGDDGDSMGTQTGLSDGEWRITFGNGTVKGEALCASNEGEWATAGTPQGTSGQYCWCRATSVDTGNGYMSVSSPSWVFSNGLVVADFCAFNCANFCANGVRDRSDFRSAVFGVQ